MLSIGDKEMKNSFLKNLFYDHFSLLCSTVVDIDNLLIHFVPYAVITEGDLEEIMTIKRTSDKVQRLLEIISGPLEAGNARNLYTMLDIFEKHGTQATKELAATMRSLITTRSKG